MSSYWYQKEFGKEELRTAFFEASSCFSIQRIKEYLRDSASGHGILLLEEILRKLCLAAVNTPNITLITKEGNFSFEEWVGENKLILQCQKTENGRLFRVSGQNSDRARQYGWQVLSNEHPLAKADIVCVGPSQHPNFTPALLCG